MVLLCKLILAGGGLLLIAGAQVVSNPITTLAPLAARLAFALSPYQHFGLVSDFSAVVDNYWAIFSTGGTAERPFARTNVSRPTQDFDLGALPLGMHDYRIVPIVGGMSFYVDGALLATLNASFPTGAPLRIAASAYQASPMQIDEMHLESYACAGEFVSRVFDAARTANWTIANRTADVPAGATLVVETRTGDTATPDSGWSTWQANSNGGAIGSPAARYIQYRVTLASNDPLLTPVLFDLTIRWN